jgi:hypothetical protein
LKHPFIRVGTRDVPVTLVPDYTFYHAGKPIFVLDAKGPRENISKDKHVRQVYSYAVHSEIGCREFGLCNGRSLVLFDVNRREPILELGFKDFEKRWADIERYLLPKFLIKPGLRNFRPDFGFKIKGLGFEGEFTMLGVRLNFFAKVHDWLYTANADCEFAGSAHCVSFDFPVAMLGDVTAGLPAPLKSRFVEALTHQPFKAIAGLTIELDLKVKLGSETNGTSEPFIPLVIQKVLDSRFNPSEVSPDTNDYPPEIFQLRKSFRVKYQWKA